LTDVLTSPHHSTQQHHFSLNTLRISSLTSWAANRQRGQTVWWWFSALKSLRTFLLDLMTCMMLTGRSNMLLQKKENQAQYNRAKQQNNPYESTVSLPHLWFVIDINAYYIYLLCHSADGAGMQLLQ